ncbi:hypothetical protein BH18THE2_BH18THE2_41480 [soil metagenome]
MLLRIDDRFTLKFLFVLTVLAFALLSIIPFQYNSIDGSLTPSTNQSGDSNITNSSASSFDNNQTLSPLSNFTAGLHQNSTRENSTNSSLPAKASNATNQAQKQDLMSSYIRQHQPSSSDDIQSQQNRQIPQSSPPPPAQQQQLQQQQQSFSQSQPQAQPPPQAYTYALPPMQQPQQQQPFAQPYPPPASPSYTIPYNPSFTQPTEVLPRILSDNNYVDSIGTLHIVGEVINESYQPARYVRITATFYDANNSVIGTDYTFTSPSTLQPGQRAPFDLTISQGSVPTYLMAYYTLSVD